MGVAQSYQHAPLGGDGALTAKNNDKEYPDGGAGKGEDEGAADSFRFLPENESSIMTEEMAQYLYHSGGPLPLPVPLQEWKLLFSSKIHGASFNTLINSICRKDNKKRHHEGRGRVPGGIEDNMMTIIVVRDKQENVFGSFNSVQWRINGTTESDDVIVIWNYTIKSFEILIISFMTYIISPQEISLATIRLPCSHLESAVQSQLQVKIRQILIQRLAIVTNNNMTTAKRNMRTAAITHISRRLVTIRISNIWVGTLTVFRMDWESAVRWVILDFT